MRGLIEHDREADGRGVRASLPYSYDLTGKAAKIFSNEEEKFRFSFKRFLSRDQSTNMHSCLNVNTHIFLFVCLFGGDQCI